MSDLKRPDAGDYKGDGSGGDYVEDVGEYCDALESVNKELLEALELVLPTLIVFEGKALLDMAKAAIAKAKCE